MKTELLLCRLPEVVNKFSNEGVEKAGEGNRTLVSSLEGYSFTIKLHPHRAGDCGAAKLPREPEAAKRFFVVAAQQFYCSLVMTSRCCHA